MYFSGGRLAGYAVFGALLGAVGAAMTVTPFASGILTLLAALIMIVLGLQMLRVVPWLNRVHIRVPKFVAHSLVDQSGKAYKPWAPFVVGAGTFFMPCGFTQALQLYVLGHANALQGGITMFVFAAGTMPMLLALGAVSSFTRGVWHSYFVRAAAVLVVLFGLLSIPAGIALVR
jgi:sulfite exporter TauE/SafE